jgi:hypothetical protein
MQVENLRKKSLGPIFSLAAWNFLQRSFLQSVPAQPTRPQRVADRPGFGPLCTSPAPSRSGAGLLTRRNQTCVGTTDWLERKDQGPPLPDGFLRGLMMPMGLNSIGLLLMSMTPHPFFSLRTVRVTRSTLPSWVGLSM